MKQRSTDRGALLALQNYFSKVQIADKDGDLDRDPYTSTSWDGDSFSAGTGTIDWVAAFGLPEKPKFVWVCVVLVDSSPNEGSGYIAFKAKNTTTNYSFITYSRPSNEVNFEFGGVAVADDGTTYYQIGASGVNTCDIWIRVIAWIR